jgi:hypothetical protein
MKASISILAMLLVAVTAVSTIGHDIASRHVLRSLEHRVRMNMQGCPAR